MSPRVNGKVALITGAGTGIGKETALLLAKEGAKLVVTDMNEETVKLTAKEIIDQGGEAVAVVHNVVAEDEWKAVVAKAIASFGTIDILFNNAGVYLIKPLAETTVEEWQKLMDVNVTGVFLGMKHVAPVMANQQSGSIINISSAAGLQGFPGHTLYGASKGAVRIMTKDVALEYAAANVRANSIHPGYINTNMAKYGAEVAETTIEEIGKNLYPLGRIGQPLDVAYAVLYLASEESAFMTGSELVLDGGAHAGTVFN